MSNNPPLVSVCCITYNHEQFIGKAIESIINQKTSFYFELIIGEDFSSDNTGMICQKYKELYSDKIKLIRSKKNIGMSDNFTQVLSSCTGKYIAICEGDDYWSDLNKLQKQVEFLEKNEEYGLVHTDFDILYENTKIVHNYYKSNEIIRIAKDDAFESLMTSWGIKTLTVCIRKEILFEALDYLLKNEMKIFDIPLFIMVAKLTRFGFIDESTAVYRVLSHSASHHLDKNIYYDHLLRNYKIKQFFIENYDVSEKTREIVKKQFYLGLFIRAVKNNDFEMIRKTYNDVCENMMNSYKYRIVYILTKFFPTRYLLRLFLCRN